MATVPKKVKEKLEKIPILLSKMAWEEMLRANALQHASDDLKKQIEIMQVEGE